MRLVVVLCVCTVLVACRDGDVSLSAEPAAASPLFECLQTDFVSFTCPVGLDIPDEDRQGVTLGPIRIPATRLPVEKILVEIDITHPYSGDLELLLYCDRDEDGRVDGTHRLEIHHMVADPCVESVADACQVTLDGLCFFWVCGMEPPDPACRQYDFQLRVSDGMVEDAGTVRSWTLHVPLRATSRLESGEDLDSDLAL